MESSINDGTSSDGVGQGEMLALPDPGPGHGINNCEGVVLGEGHEAGHQLVASSPLKQGGALDSETDPTLRESSGHPKMETPPITSSDSDSCLTSPADPGARFPSMLGTNHEDHAVESWPVDIAERVTSQQYSSSPLPMGESSPGDKASASATASAIKLLVSNNVAGSIIGRAGQTISDFQTQSGARIKLSQTGDYYPGTQDRVCLVQGPLENVKAAVKLLLERLHLLQEQQHTQNIPWQGQDSEPRPSFDFVVRILVPSSSCGMIIGKAGANIKQMEESSGVSSVRLSAKDSTDGPSSTPNVVSGTAERVLTMTGPSLESCLSCVSMVLDGMMVHHDVSRYTNLTTTYSRIPSQSGFGAMHSGAVPQGRATVGRPLHSVPSLGETSMWENSPSYHSMSSLARRSISSPDLAGQMMWDQRTTPVGVPSELPSHVMGAMRPREVAPQYNRHLYADGSQPLGPHDISPLLSAQPRHPAPNPHGMFLVQMDQVPLSNSVSAPDLLALQMQESLRIQSASSGGVEFAHGAHQIPQATQSGFVAQVHVPDSLVGSIFGRNGRTLNELQLQSNTRIRVSQRNEFVPGTRNRIVTIRGPTAQSVSMAQFLMNQRLILPPTTATYSSLHSSFHPPPLHEQQPPPQRLYPSHHMHVSEHRLAPNEMAPFQLADVHQMDPTMSQLHQDHP
eukprot:Nitzschia sp. Nitz4//scaffold86_size83305//77367//79467//NITZ4_005275-RA/size83305-augustus-gene-0.60-mRNA-1//1//CDS//3329559289//5336//frame0